MLSSELVYAIVFEVQTQCERLNVVYRLTFQSKFDIMGEKTSWIHKCCLRNTFDNAVAVSRLAFSF